MRLASFCIFNAVDPQPWWQFVQGFALTSSVIRYSASRDYLTWLHLRFKPFIPIKWQLLIKYKSSGNGISQSYWHLISFNVLNNLIRDNFAYLSFRWRLDAQSGEWIPEPCLNYSHWLLPTNIYFVKIVCSEVVDQVNNITNRQVIVMVILSFRVWRNKLKMHTALLFSDIILKAIKIATRFRFEAESLRTCK